MWEGERRRRWSDFVLFSFRKTRRLLTLVGVEKEGSCFIYLNVINLAKKVKLISFWDTKISELVLVLSKAFEEVLNKASHYLAIITVMLE